MVVCSAAAGKEQDLGCPSLRVGVCAGLSRPEPPRWEHRVLHHRAVTAGKPAPLRSVPERAVKRSPYGILTLEHMSSEDPVSTAQA